MHLYTIMLDYAGGTYVAQTCAADERAAVRDWIGMLSSDQIAHSVSEEVAAAFEDFDYGLVPLNGLAGVWCANANAMQGLALVNVVKTAA
ncbi:hypothetical protein [Phenylobacterium koreense]|uniref:PH domain-containing protein n=1 Tax=Phenylobacterium koreense TaxID=266125 RepID=A0ABV2EMH1_9CAUL